MKYIISVVILAVICYNFRYIARLENSIIDNNQRVKQLKETLSDCNNAYIEHINIIKQLEPLRDHVKRMQLIAGVKNADSVFTWKEKVLNPINTNKLLKYK